VQRYCQRTGRTDADALMADWNFYLAYNLFRLASITQGIAKRVVDGTAASAQARATGQATPTLARRWPGNLPSVRAEGAHLNHTETPTWTSAIRPARRNCRPNSTPSWPNTSTR
jgi:hypothetical protein